MYPNQFPVGIGHSNQFPVDTGNWRWLYNQNHPLYGTYYRNPWG